MKLFNRSGNAEEKWHKKALFVDFNKTRVVFVDTTETKPESEPSWIPKMGPQFVIEELLNQEEYGLLGFFSCHSNRQPGGNVIDRSGLTSVQVVRAKKRKDLNCGILLPQNRLPFPIIPRCLL